MKGCLQRIEEQRPLQAGSGYYLLAELVYLAVILGAFSRRVIGWALDRSLKEELTLGALGMTLKRRKPAAGLVHHSDRGVPYASRDYTTLLAEHGIRSSMSRRGKPYDNAVAESFIKTLKYEKCTGRSIARTARSPSNRWARGTGWWTRWSGRNTLRT